MKKLAFTGFEPYYTPNQNSFRKLISSDCKIEEVAKMSDADFLLCSVLTDTHWFAPTDCVKILYSGENITPNFMACDYAIGFDWLDFGDRYIRFPLYYFYERINELMETKHIGVNLDDLRKIKTGFCSITVSNTKRNPIFKELYDKLSMYKRVDSGGKWHNNIGGPISDKFVFDSSHKFSIVCENSSSPGYTTEKIVEAFAAHCIPVYWGDPEITRVFNKNAFINVSDYSSVEDVVECVKKIDSDDELYVSYLSQPALTDSLYKKEKQMILLKKWLNNIFSKSPDQAHRRNRDCLGTIYVDKERTLIMSYNKIYKTKVFLYRLFTLKWAKLFEKESYVKY